MGFNAGSDVSTSDLITAAKWNLYMGSSGSITYLKTEADKVDALTVDASPSRVKSTIYQNTSGKTRYVQICCSIPNNGGVSVECDSGNPPTVDVGAIHNEGGQPEHFSITFLVINNYYYRLNEDAGTISVSQWIEWAEH